MKKASKNVAVRTCVICRKKCDKRMLERFVWEDATETLVADRTQVLPGRGAYCCFEEACRQRFLARKWGWRMAFRLKK